MNCEKDFLHFVHRFLQLSKHSLLSTYFRFDGFQPRMYLVVRGQDPFHDSLDGVDDVSLVISPCRIVALVVAVVVVVVVVLVVVVVVIQVVVVLLVVVHVTVWTLVVYLVVMVIVVIELVVVVVIHVIVSVVVHVVAVVIVIVVDVVVLVKVVECIVVVSRHRWVFVITRSYLLYLVGWHKSVSKFHTKS